MDILDLWYGALVTTAMVGAPFLVVTLAVGLLVSVVQAATQLQENVLVFVPKLMSVGLVLALSGHWLLSELTSYTQASAAAMVEIARSRR